MSFPWKQEIRLAVVYVSMTGFRPKGIGQLPMFWWRTIQSIRQARRAPGNLAVTARIVDGIYHTMTSWSDKASMSAFVASGAHLAAMRGFRSLGEGWVYGCNRDELTDWDTMYRLWKLHGRVAGGPAVSRSGSA
jgi:hypothetical protein